MHRRPSSRPVRVLASALAAGALLTCAACSGEGDGGAGGDSASDVAASPLAAESKLASPRTGKSASPASPRPGPRPR